MPTPELPDYYPGDVPLGSFAEARMRLGYGLAIVYLELAEALAGPLAEVLRKKAGDVWPWGDPRRSP